ncbi:hypothetical protein ACFL59_13565 [Planctomycetota bacterium]
MDDKPRKHALGCQKCPAREKGIPFESVEQAREWGVLKVHECVEGAAASDSKDPALGE